MKCGVARVTVRASIEKEFELLFDFHTPPRAYVSPVLCSNDLDFSSFLRHASLAFYLLNLNERPDHRESKERLGARDLRVSIVLIMHQVATARTAAVRTRCLLPTIPPRNSLSCVSVSSGAFPVNATTINSSEC